MFNLISLWVRKPKKFHTFVPKIQLYISNSMFTVTYLLNEPMFLRNYFIGRNLSKFRRETCFALISHKSRMIAISN